MQITFDPEVEEVLARAHPQHHEKVRHHVLHDYREWLGSEVLLAGGHWAVAALVNKALRESFEARRSP